MKYYIIAGEASGDIHAANLIKEIKFLDKQAHFRAWGGDRMNDQGVELVKHYHELAFMGFYEVIVNLKTILQNIKFCKQDIIRFKPDVLILIDYPGFNLRIAKFARKHEVRVFYYISPQIWAWRQSRIKKIKKYVNRMYVILPFEKDFYLKHNIEVDYVGHPLLDVIENEKANYHDLISFKDKNNLENKPIIALLPGSRKQEIAKMLPTMLTIPDHFPEYQFVIAGTNAVENNFYKRSLNEKAVKVIYQQTHQLLRHAEAAIVTSGTATLETALMNVPQIVCYKGNWFSYQIAKRVIKTKYISLVNLILNKPVVTELIQKEMNSSNLHTELKNILNPEIRQRILNDYSQLHKVLGSEGASKQVAKLMVNRLLEY